jgi:dienelactone hydrolase
MKISFTSPVAMRWSLPLWGIVLACSTAAQQTETQPAKLTINRYEIKIPMAAAGDAGLRSYLLLPSNSGKHPLVLMTHGTNYSNGKNREMGPGTLQPEALWFARRGWAVAIVVRRGYGDSGGEMDRKQYGCSEADFEHIAERDAADLQTAYDYFARLREIDAKRVIAVGASTGGFAAISFGVKANPPINAVINFSGGWHSLFFSGSCTKSGLVPAFQELGSESHVPMLWIYAKNDSLFGPKYVSQVHEAFTSGGGTAELIVVDRSGDDGHYLFSEGQQIWSPIVEKYLASQGLPSFAITPDPPDPVFALPTEYSGAAQDGFAVFLKLGPYKAFAVGPDGRWSYSVGKKTAKIAADEALDRCGDSRCVVIAKGGN